MWKEGRPKQEENQVGKKGKGRRERNKKTKGKGKRAKKGREEMTWLRK